MEKLRKEAAAQPVQLNGQPGQAANKLWALEMALENKNGPTVIDCIIDKDESVFPMIPAGKSIDDVMLA